MVKLITLPFTKRRLAFGLTRPEDAAAHFRALEFQTNLRADYYHRGRHQGHRDLGSGAITYVATLALASEGIALAAPSGAAINTLFLARHHFTGTGTTTDTLGTSIKMETISTQGGQTAPGSPTQSLIATSATTVQFRSVATVSYTGSEAVTEWGLHTSATRSATTGSPFTATSATGGTVTGTPLTASSSTVQGLQQNIVETTTTPRWGFITSNSTSGIVIPAWYVTSTGAAGSTPGSTEAYTLRPILLDRKTFAAINVVNTDSIQFTYTLTITPGG